MAATFWLYTLGILSIGLFSARFSRRSNADFFLADRGLGAWVAALSASASAESGWVMLGLVGSAFKIGLAAFWIIPGTVLAFVINWVVLANRLRKASAKGALTIPDILTAPHRGKVALWIRSIAVLVIFCFLGTYVAAQLSAAGKMFEATFGWNYVAGVLVGAAIVLVYTVFGGFRAVAWTDVAQAILMIIALVGLPLLLLFHMGGISNVYIALAKLETEQQLLHPLAAKTGLAALGFLSLWLGIPWGNLGQPHVLIRFMAIKDERALNRAAIISTIWVFFLFTGAVALGLIGRAYYGSLPDPEKLLPLLAVELLPGPLTGLILAGVLAAICSTADSQLLVAGSSISHDCYIRLFGKKPNDRIQFFLNRGTVLAVGLVATVVAATKVRVIFDFVLYAWAGLGAVFGPAILITLFVKRLNGWAVVASMGMGLLTAVVWRETASSIAYELIPAFCIALLSSVIVQVLWPPEQSGSKKLV